MPITINRRHALMIGAGVTGLGGGSASATADSGLSLAGLRVQQLENPIGLDSQAVRLSWQLRSGGRGIVQQSYQVVVATSAEALRAGKADLWDSGRVVSRDNLDIIYKGARLTARQKAYWRVKVWDEAGASAESQIATWEMGLLAPADWKGRWLACETAKQSDNRKAGLRWVQGEDASNKSPAHFRMTFDLPQDAALSIYVGASRIAAGASLDGEALSFPYRAPFAWGPPPVEQFERSAKAGKHVVTLAFDAAGGFGSTSCAVTVRADLADGSVRYFVSPQARHSTGADGAWTAVDFDAAGWSLAKPAASQLQSWPGEGAFLLRKAFETRGAVVSARFYAAALGGYEISINGQRVGDALLEPQSTEFRERVYYRAYDVTKLVAAGGNAVGVWLADGWYGSYNAPAGRYAFGDPPLRFLGQLELVYANGETQVVATDTQWAMSSSPISMAEIYNGEDYDARLEQPGWDGPTFTPGKAWTPAVTGETPAITVCAMECPPIRATQTLKAKSIKQVRPGVFIFDFGQNFAGLPRLAVKGQAGHKVTLRFAEVLKSNGEIDQSNLRAARAADTYVLRGDPQGEIYVPRFTYHGFRWVELTGFPGEPTVESLQALVIHTDLTETSLLKISDPTIQALWHNALWSQRSNFVGLPTDCPQRDERLGWMGDANVFWDAAAFNMNVASFTRRFMRDVRDGQAANGAFSDFSPRGGPRAGEEAQASPGWSDAGVILPWTSYQRFGDTAVIDENWEAMARYIAMIVKANPNLLWENKRGRDYADWLALDAKAPGDPTTPKDLVGTAAFKHSVDAMRDMAQATGRGAERDHYAQLSGGIRKAFIDKFVGADGAIGNGSQTGYILALNYDLVPEALRGAALAKLVADIKRRGTLLSTGFLGTPGSLDCLEAGGMDTLVYDLLLRREFPSWGYMVAKGATTVWERWNGDTGDVAMNSFNHYALGAVSGFIFRRVAGISPLQPGFRRFLFDPVYDARVPGCEAVYDSVLGRIAVNWKRDAQAFLLDLEVPPNAEAIVRLPVTKSATEGGAPLERGKGLRDLKWEASGAIVTVGSGRYTFRGTSLPISTR